jgi:hypothetical protein
MSQLEMEMGEAVRKCQFCYQSFALQEDLVKHLNEVHCVEEEPRTFAGVLINCEEDRTRGAVLVGMLREPTEDARDIQQSGLPRPRSRSAAGLRNPVPFSSDGRFHSTRRRV